MNYLNKIFFNFIFAVFATISCFSMATENTTKPTKLTQVQQNSSLTFYDNGLKIEIGIDKEPCLTTFYQYGVLWVKLTNNTPTQIQLPKKLFNHIKFLSTQELQKLKEKRNSRLEKIIFSLFFCIENRYLAKHKNYEKKTLVPNETVTQFMYLYPCYFRIFKEALLSKPSQKIDFEKLFEEDDYPPRTSIW